MAVMNIKELREAAGLSQQQLAAAMGVLQSTVSNWETEIALPRARQLSALAAALGCTINDLFVPSDKASQTNEVLAG